MIALPGPPPVSAARTTSDHRAGELPIPCRDTRPSEGLWPRHIFSACEESSSVGDLQPAFLNLPDREFRIPESSRLLRNRSEPLAGGQSPVKLSLEGTQHPEIFVVDRIRILRKTTGFGLKLAVLTRVHTVLFSESQLLSWVNLTARGHVEVRHLFPVSLETGRGEEYQ